MSVSQRFPSRCRRRCRRPFAAENDTTPRAVRAPMVWSSPPRRGCRHRRRGSPAARPRRRSPPPPRSAGPTCAADWSRTLGIFHGLHVLPPVARFSSCGRIGRPPGGRHPGRARSPGVREHVARRAPRRSPPWSRARRAGRPITTSGMSCSMTNAWRSPARCGCGPAGRRAARPPSGATPPAVSSRSSTEGWWPTTHASSTIRRVPVDSSAVKLSVVHRSEQLEQLPDPPADRQLAVVRGGQAQRGVDRVLTATDRSRDTATVSATVNPENRRPPWKVRPSPWRPLRGRQVRRVVPFRRMRPPSRGWKPLIRSRIVVLPAPFWPIRPTISPGRRSG